jgi:hypothetical protein
MSINELSSFPQQDDGVVKKPTWWQRQDRTSRGLLIAALVVVLASAVAVVIALLVKSKNDAAGPVIGGSEIIRDEPPPFPPQQSTVLPDLGDADKLLPKQWFLIGLYEGDAVDSTKQYLTVENGALRLTDNRNVAIAFQVGSQTNGSALPVQHTLLLTGDGRPALLQPNLPSLLNVASATSVGHVNQHCQIVQGDVDRGVYLYADITSVAATATSPASSITRITSTPRPAMGWILKRLSDADPDQQPQPSQLLPTSIAARPIVVGDTMVMRHVLTNRYLTADAAAATAPLSLTPYSFDALRFRIDIVDEQQSLLLTDHTIEIDDAADKLASVRRNVTGVLGVYPSPPQYNRLVSVVAAERFLMVVDPSAKLVTGEPPLLVAGGATDQWVLEQWQLPTELDEPVQHGDTFVVRHALDNRYVCLSPAYDGSLILLPSAEQAVEFNVTSPASQLSGLLSVQHVMTLLSNSERAKLVLNLSQSVNAQGSIIGLYPRPVYNRSVAFVATQNYMSVLGGTNLIGTSMPYALWRLERRRHRNPQPAAPTPLLSNTVGGPLLIGQRFVVRNLQQDQLLHRDGASLTNVPTDAMLFTVTQDNVLTGQPSLVFTEPALKLSAAGTTAEFQSGVPGGMGVFALAVYDQTVSLVENSLYLEWSVADQRLMASTTPYVFWQLQRWA